MHEQEEGDQPAPGDQARSSEDRLESWKEIASYLNRDVRTVRRWEKNEGLPVRRHMHDRLATVYAFRSELDAWTASRQPAGQAPQPPRPRSAPPRWLWWTVGVLVALTTGWIVVRVAFQSSTPVEDRPWVLIAQFENRTGEPTFDGAVEYALERELSSSRYVNVAPRERITDSLQLMRLPAQTVVDRALGREVALRDGGIRVVMTGRIERLESTYLVSVLLVEPSQGVSVASFSEDAADQRAVLPAVRRLSDAVRHWLGEELASIRRNDTSLERVTTPSLRALRLYSEAQALTIEFRWEQAIAVLEQAVAEDPEFASAHVLLAHAHDNLGRTAEAARHFEKAFALSSHAADHERYFIAGSYFHHRGGTPEDTLQAIDQYETLVRLHPDHYHGVTNLAVLHHSRGGPEEAAAYTLRRADLRPGSFDQQMAAAEAAARWRRDDEAHRYLERARVLSADDDSPTGQWRAGRLRIFPARVRWMRGDLDGALREGDVVARPLGDAPGTAVLDRWNLACLHLAMGRTTAARELLDPRYERATDRALLAMAQGDVAEARRLLQGAPSSYQAAVLFTRLGMLDAAESAAAHPESARRAEAPFLPGVWQDAARGELALARGDATRAVAFLERALRIQAAWPTSYYFLASDALSRAWEQQGDLDRSLQVLELSARQGRSAIFWGPAPIFWMTNELRRAGLYRRLGREDAAVEVERQLGALLAMADADFTIRRRLEEGG